ncbi:hypothetical protein HD806DRAFT_493507 [Xylariaceae sp. AK1471]|nr:hypothetical protein HD806DRAFT_493507 [Xylariaceae sp. AK1471]
MDMPLTVSEAGGPSESILRCTLCGKPFIKQLTYRRHLSYCRKTQNRQRVRNRACRACNIAKTKCTSENTCQRCRLRGIRCAYDQHGGTVEVPRTHESGFTIGIPDNSSAISTVPTANDELQLNALPTDNESHLPDFTNNEVLVDIDMPERNQGIGVTSETQALLPFSISQQRPLPSSWLYPQRGDPSWTDGEDNSLLFEIESMREVRGEIEIPPRIHQMLGTLTHIRHANTITQHNARLVMQSIRTYPFMMLRRETFPPFIHPQWYRQTSPALPWPLANCMSIANLFVSRTLETGAFLWQTVKTETQKCLDEMNSLSEECLLAAIQAQSMYIIMRLADGVTEPDDLDLQLLIAFKVLCQHLKVQNDGLYLEPTGQDWESWIRTESKIRILIVFFLISRVVSVSPGMACCVVNQYSDTPLCSGKGLWEAKTSATWASEYAAYAQTQGGRIHTIGEMIELHRVNRNRIRSNELARWGASADSLGILLNSVLLGLAHA